jgi:uncharacterized membrane protein SpoIIM required for sporulation
MIIWDDLKSRFSRGAEAEKGDIAAAALRSDRFRQAREGDWQRLEKIVSALEKGSFRRLSDADVLDLPVLYRTLASSLSVARETTLDAATLAYLEALAQRAWFQVYGPRESFTGWLRGFFNGGWSRAVRGIAPDILIALAVMVAGVAVGWLLVAHDPAWYSALVEGERVRVPSASREALVKTLFGHQDQEGLGVFATFLFGHNSQISIMAYAVGFALGVPSILLLVANTGNLGAMLWLYWSKGLLLDFVGWLSIHGTTELFAILLAGASGIHVGRAIAFPGERAIMASVAAAGRRTAPVMLGVVLMLLCAGMLEGFGRQLIDATPMRLAIGGGMLCFWLGYFFTFARGRA